MVKQSASGGRFALKMDESIALLAQIFEHVSLEKLKRALEISAGDVETATLRLSTSAEVNQTDVNNQAGCRASFGKRGLFPVRKRVRNTSSNLELTSSGNISKKRHVIRVRELYMPNDVSRHLPCSLYLNILPKELATILLENTLMDSKAWKRHQWYLFERQVESPHTSALYFDQCSLNDTKGIEHWYNGRKINTERPMTENMYAARAIISKIVNEEWSKRIKHACEAKMEWWPNAVVANKYADSSEGVGYHADQLCNIGPRPIIASLSLGATRSFRLKRTVLIGEDSFHRGTIAVQLPHNSLLIMFPPCQELYQHSVPPVKTIPRLHSISGSMRFNLTFRMFRPEWSVSKGDTTGCCKCGIPGVIRCIKNGPGAGKRYFRACQASAQQSGNSCGWFEWVHQPPEIIDGWDVGPFN